MNCFVNIIIIKRQREGHGPLINFLKITFGNIIGAFFEQLLTGINNSVSGNKVIDLTEGIINF